MTASTSSVLILGATSDMGRAIAQCFAAEGHPIILAARQVADVAADCQDLLLRHQIEVSAIAFDALDTGAHEELVSNLAHLPEIAICCVGLLGDQTQSETDWPHANLIMRSNYEGPASILATLANAFEARGSGTLVGISSVAGDRGRAKNYTYGSAKAGFTAFLSGLRNRLASKGVHVITVKPGFVYTRMTEGMDLPAKLTARPDQVGQRVLKAVKKKQDTVYVLGIWWLIMRIICAIPEWKFKRMDI
jgi:short-subunit dehydrogenase